jgi:hypothetical protein
MAQMSELTRLFNRIELSAIEHLEIFVSKKTRMPPEAAIAAMLSVRSHKTYTQQKRAFLNIMPAHHHRFFDNSQWLVFQVQKKKVIQEVEESGMCPNFGGISSPFVKCTKLRDFQNQKFHAALCKMNNLKNAILSITKDLDIGRMNEFLRA